MKEIDELHIPDDLRYAEDHEWARTEGDRVRVGISDYAQDQLSDVVFVELPEVGDTFGKGEVFGTVESVKAVVEMYMPIGGEIHAVNEALQEAPELVNQSPYDKGWFIEIKASDPSEMETLMGKEAYLQMLTGMLQE